MSGLHSMCDALLGELLCGQHEGVQQLLFLMAIQMNAMIQDLRYRDRFVPRGM
jgi:hypothetical protein